MTAYDQLETRFGRIGSLKEVMSVLEWDHAAMMPVGGAVARADQVSTVELVVHELLTDPRLPDLFDEAAGQNELELWQRANLAEMRRVVRHAGAVTDQLVDAKVRQAHECEMIWRTARPDNDFAAVKPSLKRLLGLIKETAQAKASVLGCAPYEALLDEFEPGGTVAEIDALFEALVAFLPQTITAIIERQAAAPAPLQPPGPFPITAQRDVALRFMQAIGFDFEHGRLDISAHPFCGGTPDDVRITTRYREDDFSRALMGVLHETGHAMYERGLPKAWRRQPVGKARGMSLHESQSLLIEMQACRSPEFLSFAAPLLRENFGGSGPAWTPENLFRLNTRVRRSLIRVDADEATYPAHVILRYRLEKAMIAGDLAVDDLPGAWSDGLRELVGIVPPDDRDGCLQDIHWYAGLWGYFPTYTMGALSAAQLFEAATRADPTILPGIGLGDFSALMRWLRREIHERASATSTRQIMIDATGAPLSVDAFRRHLERRYLGVD
jgi:carboxypeptidase Taq